MAYAHSNLRITFGGKIYNKEIWSNSLHVGHEESDFSWSDGNGGLVNPEAIANAVLEWFVDPNARHSSAASLDWVKFAVLGTDGKYIADPQIVDFTTGNRGAAPVGVAPQLTVACTLTTDALRGLARFGRIYPPLNAYPDSEGFAQGRTEMLANFKQFIEQINYLFNLGYGLGPKVIVASGVREGRNKTVTGVKIGKVIDTQRTRRNDLDEDYLGNTVNVNPLSMP